MTKEEVPARAYIQFKNLEHVATFSREFDGHVFRDKQGIYSDHPASNINKLKFTGREYYSVVEFAPFQKVPPQKERMKVDQRMNTIEKGAQYAIISILKCLRAIR